MNLRASSKRQTDVLEITTFLPTSDSLFDSRLMFKQSYLMWSDYILNFNERNQKTPKFAVKTTQDEGGGGGAQHYSALFFCFYVND